MKYFNLLIIHYPFFPPYLSLYTPTYILQFPILKASRIILELHPSTPTYFNTRKHFNNVHLSIPQTHNSTPFTIDTLSHPSLYCIITPLILNTSFHLMSRLF